eukprot:SAG22_NODE_2814_length_2185_cov_5.070470_2_plen_332_part_00
MRREYDRCCCCSAVGQATLKAAIGERYGIVVCLRLPSLARLLARRIGCCWGSLFGWVVGQIHDSSLFSFENKFGSDRAAPYSLIGAVAMLGGVQRSSLSLVVIIVEVPACLPTYLPTCLPASTSMPITGAPRPQAGGHPSILILTHAPTHCRCPARLAALNRTAPNLLSCQGTGKIDYLLPIILTTIVSKWLGDQLNEGLYHTALHMKGMPFLDTGGGHGNGIRGMALQTAGDVMGREIRQFGRVERVAVVLAALDVRGQHLPLFEPPYCSTPPTVRTSLLFEPPYCSNPPTFRTPPLTIRTSTVPTSRAAGTTASQWCTRTSTATRSSTV